ncbi:uncharacterized protein LOC125177803, partial [Hyalella azteca]|uniref:Uncharacterized protein LOC125177803 n=1 Tax=Hyalella azteca TaxID=294128 RepID=A0A979FIR1_HYAAZ
MSSHIHAAAEAWAEVSCLGPHVVPKLRVMALAQGWHLNVVYGPVADARDDATFCVTARDVTDVAEAVLAGVCRTSVVIPLVLWHGQLDSPVLPSSITRTCHAQLLDHLVSDQHKDLLDKWYRPDHPDGDDFFLVPAAINYPDMHSADAGERDAARRQLADDSQTLITALTEHCQQLVLPTPLELETAALQHHDAVSSAVLVTVQCTDTPQRHALPLQDDRLQTLHHSLQSIPVSSRLTLTRSGADSHLSSQLTAALSSKISALNARRKTAVEKCR